MSINQKINELAIDKFNGNNVDFAKIMGTSEANIRNYRKNIQPKLDFIIKLNQKLGVSFEELLLDEPAHPKLYPTTEEESREVNEPDKKYLLRTDSTRAMQEVPLYDISAAAGLTQLFQKKNDIIDYIKIPDIPRCDGAIRIVGDSMYPLLKSGDIVMYKVINDLAEGIFWGEMYLLSIKIDGEQHTLVKFIKKSEKGDDFVCLVSQNAHHASKDVRLKSIKAIALIKASIRINSMT